MPRKPKANSSKNYFTQETENYIIKYNNTESVEEKNKIFTDHIYYPFYKLAENIIHTFKFYYTDVDKVEDLKLEVVTMLVRDKIHLFDPTRGAKAYSYFGTIVKRWLIAYNNDNYKKRVNQTSIDYYNEDIPEEREIETEPTLSLSLFMDNWIAETYSNLDELFPKESEKKIADAILTIFKTRQDIQIFKKKALYVYIREIIGCDTVYLTKVVQKLKTDFYSKYQKLLDEGLISENY